MILPTGRSDEPKTPNSSRSRAVPGAGYLHRKGAAVRDESGRTYSSASVSLFSLHLSALQAAVAQAAASGARGLEAAVLVVDHGVADAEGVSAVRDLGGVGVPLLVVDAAGTVTSTTHT